MKNKFMLLMAGMLLIAGMSNAQELEKKIVGKWCNPYTYQSSGELKGFEFKEDGKCEAINIPVLDLKTWKIVDGKLIIEGFEMQEDGQKVPYQTEERISVLNQDTLSLVAQEKNPHLEFIYINTKVIGEKVKQNPKK